MLIQVKYPKQENISHDPYRVLIESKQEDLELQSSELLELINEFERLGYEASVKLEQDEGVDHEELVTLLESVGVKYDVTLKGSYKGSFDALLPIARIFELYNVKYTLNGKFPIREDSDCNIDQRDGLVDALSTTFSMSPSTREKSLNLLKPLMEQLDNIDAQYDIKVKPKPMTTNEFIDLFHHYPEGLTATITLKESDY